MKRTCARWTNIQNVLFDRDESILWSRIERRTLGKSWSQDVAIGFNKADEAKIVDAEKQLDESEGATHA